MSLLDDIPAAQGGAPEPFIFCDERHLDLIYFISDPATQKLSNDAIEVLEDDGEIIASLRFNSCLQHKFGHPNEEVLHGRPDYDFGLEYCACTEFEGSGWYAEIERLNQIHPNHKSGMYSSYRHFVFPFHDSTFECLAQSYETHVYKAWQHQVLQERLKSVSEWLREET